jgi:hypothetical protein
VAKVSLELKPRKTSRAKYEGSIRSFKQMGIRSIPEQSVKKVQSIGNRSSLGGWLVIAHKAKSIGYVSIKDV